MSSRVLVLALGIAIGTTGLTDPARATSSGPSIPAVVSARAQPLAASAPGIPATLTAVARSASSIRLDWTPPSDTGSSPITGYVITRPAQPPLNISASARTRTFRDLDPATSYTFTLAAKNSTGTGPAQEATAITEQEARPPSIPATLTAVARSASSIRLDWTPPSDTGSSPITGYVITRPAQPPLNISASARTRTFRDLDPATSYTFTLAAKNSTGTGPAQEATAITEQEARPPSIPATLTAVARSASSIRLDWTPPSDTGSSPITGYVITRPAQPPLNISASARTRTFRDLDPATSYTFTLAAKNSTGTGPAQEATTATRGGEPSVSSFAPRSGSAVGGDVIAIQGAHLDRVDTVKFGDVESEILAADSQTMTVATPPHTVGEVSLYFFVDGVQIFETSVVFEFLEPTVDPTDTYRASSQTVTLMPSDVASIESLPTHSYEVVLQAVDARFPDAEFVYLRPGHPDASTGLAAKITYVDNSSGVTILRVQQVALDQVLDSHNFQQSATVDNTATVRRSVSLAKSLAGAPTRDILKLNQSFLSCERVVIDANGNERTEPLFEETADIQASFTIENLQVNLIDVDQPGRRYYEATVSGEPTLRIVAQATAALSCELKPELLRRLKLDIPVGSFRLKVTPKFNAKFTASGKAVLEKRYFFKVGMRKSGNSNPQFINELTNKPTTVSGTAELGFKATVGVDVSLLYASTIGLYGEVGPTVEAKYEFHPSVPEHCLSLAMGLQVEVGARLDLIVKAWDVPAFSWSPTLGVEWNCTAQEEIPEMSVLEPDLGDAESASYITIPTTGGSSPFPPGTFEPVNYGDAYILRQDLTLESGKNYFFHRSLSIPEGVSLTVEPGVHIKLGHCYWTVWLPAQGCVNLTGGSLYMRGSSGEPIVMTRYSNDAVDGNTDGVEESESRYGVAPLGLDLGVATFSHVRFVGAPAFAFRGGTVSVRASSFTEGGLISGGSHSQGHLSVVDSFFGANSGIDAGGVTISLRRSTFDNSVISFGGAGSTQIEANFFSESGLSFASPDTTISGNTFANVAMPQLHTGPNGAAATVLNNQVTHNGQVGLPPLAMSVAAGQLSADREWDADLTYVLSSGVAVPEGRTLRIGAGAVVKCQNGYSYSGTRPCLDMYGGLTTTGTDTNPVTLTAVNDNTIGGDTTEPTGYGNSWSMNLGSNTTLDLTHTTIRHATRMNLYPGARATLDNVTAVSDDATIASSDNLTVRDSTFRRATNDGTSSTALQINSGTEPRITGSRFINTTIHTNEPTTIITGNTFQTPGPAISASPDGAAATINSNTSDNAPLAMSVAAGQLSADREWDADLTYVLSSGVAVPEGRTLRIGAGAVVKCQNGYSYSGTRPCLDMYGGLTTTGTDTNPVTLTAVNDNTIGGDTTEPTGYGNSWSMNLGSNTTLDLTHTTIRHATRMNLYPGARATLDNVTAVSDDATIASSDNLTVRDSTFRRATNDGTSSTALQINSGTEPRITGSRFINTTIHTNEPTTIITGNTFQTPGPAISASPDGAAATINSNTSDNAPLAMSVAAGQLSADREWDADLTYVLSSGVAVPEGRTLRIGAGAVVKCQNGYSYSGTRPCLDMYGGLTTTGTDTNPVTLTAVNDNTIGGDTTEPTGYGNSWSMNLGSNTTLDLTHTTIRHATRMNLYPGARATLDNVTAVSDDATIASSDNLTVRDSTFRRATNDGTSSTALQINSGTEPRITGSRFINTTIHTNEPTTIITGNTFTLNKPGVVNGAASAVIAAHNWWGSSSGPVTNGPNAQVSGLVIVDPWCQTPGCSP